MSEKLAVIDLDGTFVSVNTFHHWMRYTLITSLKKREIGAAFGILRITLLRLFKRVTHAQMKHSVLRISETLMHESEIEAFIDTLDPYINTNLRQLLAEGSYTTILATAAPQIYAEILGRRYGFDHTIATPPTTVTPWKENLREAKRDSLFTLLEKCGRAPHIDLLYTDHHDDLPLMEHAKEIVLIHPSPTTVRITNAHSFSYRSID
jgi:phosphoserine phosphatase